MAFDITGKLIDIQPVVQVSDKFRKREFVIERKESGGGGAVFVDYIKFQLVQDKCDLISENMLNEDIRVTFNIKGNKWERDGKVNYFTNLDAWKVERAGAQQASGYNNPPPGPLEDMPPEIDDLNDLPF